jgi:hypothetical protein
MVAWEVVAWTNGSLGGSGLLGGDGGGSVRGDGGKVDPGDKLLVTRVHLSPGGKCYLLLVTGGGGIKGYNCPWCPSCLAYFSFT